LFHTIVLVKLGSDFIRPPTVFCHVMNMDEEMMAKR
jgi:hypothetical protein